MKKISQKRENRKWTKEQIDLIKRLYIIENRSRKEIQQMFNLSKGGVNSVFDRYNIKKNTSELNKTLLEIENLYINQNLTAKQIADKLGIELYTIKNFLHKTGIKKKQNDVLVKSLNQHANLIRILTLINRARSFQYPNAVKLAAEFKTDLRTIKRDIEFAKTVLQAPLKYIAKERGYLLTQKYTLDEVRYAK